MDWKSIVSTIAPGLATALGGPLAGVAVRTLSQVLLGTPDGSEADIEKAVLAADPAALAALRQAEMQFQKEMKALDVDLEKIAAGDRDSARKRQVATGDKAPLWLGAFVLLMWGATQATLILFGVPGSLDPMVTARILSMLDAAALLVLYYFFGSSAGSAAKQGSIDRLAAGSGTSSARAP
jgi:hypothetical protein